MLKLGITGGIGSGKSLVCRMLNELGIPVFESDKEGRAALLEPHVIDSIAERFGKDVLSKGQINRAALAKIVFNSSDELDALEAIIHPVVRDRFTNWCAQQTDVPFVIQEAAVMIESGGYKLLDKVVLVEAPQAVRIKRVMERDGVGEEAVKARMAAQLSDEERRPYGDYIIHNDSKSPLLKQVLDIYNELKHVSASESMP